MVCYGFVAGIMLGRIFFFRKRASGLPGSEKVTMAAAGSERPKPPSGAEEKLEQQYYQLEEKLKSVLDENRRLERTLAEYEQLSRLPQPENVSQDSGDSMAENNGMDRTDSLAEVPETVSLYYLQPTRDGFFREAGKVSSAADALYELRYQIDNPVEASFKFIDSPNKVFIAVQNEQSWILVACERSNVPSGDTQSIHTDTHGKALRREDEWEIVQKAMITYNS